MSLFPYIVIGGRDPLKLDIVVSSGLKARIAFILMLDSPDEVDREIIRAEEDIVFSLVGLVAKKICADAIRLMDTEETYAFSSIEHFRQNSNPPTEDGWWEDLHVPSLVTMERNGSLSGIMVCEEWFNVGGPWPYHDSYTFATYLKDESARQQVLAAVMEMCKQSAIPQPQLVSLP